MTVDLKNSLEEIQQSRREQRAANSRRGSRLDRYRSDIESLRSMGASCEDIRLWLRRHKRMRITRVAIHYRLKAWELQDGKTAEEQHHEQNED